MTVLSIHLPDTLAKASQNAAEELGISRTQFIRQAVIHELQSFHVQREREAMVKSFEKMAKDPVYMKELKSIERGFATHLPEEKEEWWEKKK